jgi:flagellar basal-body rod modification protein FlgD
MEAVQSAALIGRDVLVPGNHVSVAEGVGEGAFELSGAAEHVSVEVTGPNGQVLETLQLGKLPAGVHHFNWPAGDWTDASGVKFSVKATTGGGAGRIVDAKPMMQDRVEAVTTSPTGLMLHTQRSGAVDFSSIKTIL